MSKIGNHRMEIEASEGYRLGWLAAEQERPQLPKTDKIREHFRRGWQDYHDTQVQP